MRDLTEWLLRIDWSNSAAVKKPTREWFEDASKVFLRVPYHPPITGPFKHWWGREKGRPHPNLYCCGAGLSTDGSLRPAAENSGREIDRTGFARTSNASNAYVLPAPA